MIQSDGSSHDFLTFPKMDNKILSDKFMTFSQAFDGMKKERRSRDNEKICKYGVSLLDNELGGILENELVVIGAGTGI